MGTTLVLAARSGNRVTIANVGDSRAYQIGNGINQITKDHSLVQALVDQSIITKEQAKKDPRKTQITRCLGSDQATPDIFEIVLADGESLLLCSDGLTKMLSDQEIHKIIRGSQSAEDACQKLIQAANRAGGQKGASNNVTAVLITNRGRVAPPALPAPPRWEKGQPTISDDFFAELPHFDRPNWESGVSDYINRHAAILGKMFSKYNLEGSLPVGDMAVVLAGISHMYYMIEHWPKNAKYQPQEGFIAKLNNVAIKMLGGKPGK